MTRSKYNKCKKKGVASVLGILLMVGILITSILPTFIYINEVNNYYDRVVVELGIADQDRSLEDLTVFGYAHNETGKAIDIFLINSGSISLNVTRIWVIRSDLKDKILYNSTNLACLPLQMIASNRTTITNLDLTAIVTDNENLDYFNIEVSTNRGKKYSSQTNSLHYTSTGEWETGTQDFQIQVIVASGWGLSNYQIEVTGVDNSTSGYYDRAVSYQVHGDFFTVFSIPKIGSYNVTVNEWEGGGYNRPVGESTVVLTWSHPNALRQFDDT